MDTSDYIRERIRKDEEFVLYRGEHRSKRDAPSVFLLAPASARPALETLKGIEREYSLRDGLDSAWAVRPLALSEHRGHPVLVLENPGGETLDQLLPGPVELPQFLRLAAGLANALKGLHKRGLIHKNLQPANVLVDAATGQVRLMGFGISSRLPRERQYPSPPESIAGTLAYMAPEQRRSDTMHCRIEQLVYIEGPAVLMVSGRLQGQHVDTLRALLAPEGGVMAIDLKDVLLVDREAVTLLALSERDGIELRSCPAYVREWVAGERTHAGSGPRDLEPEASDDREDE